MSQENVEIIRRAWEAFNRGGVEASMPYWAADCVFEDFPDMPDRGVHVGHDGVREAVRTFTNHGKRPAELIDVGQYRVIAVIGFHAAGSGSGAPLDATMAWLYDLRGGKVARARALRTKEQALEAAGLSE